LPANTREKCAPRPTDPPVRFGSIPRQIAAAYDAVILASCGVEHSLKGFPTAVQVADAEITHRVRLFSTAAASLQEESRCGREYRSCRSRSSHSSSCLRADKGPTRR